MTFRKILILGGTRYIGKKLVSMLQDNGDHVTIVTRGNSPIPKGCSFIQFDRSLRKKLVTQSHWDVVYDQSCYYSNHMYGLKDIIQNCGLYVFSSSQAVYKPGLDIKENAAAKIVSDEINEYGREKLKSEAFIRANSDNFIIPRFGSVVGVNDYLNRIQKLMIEIRSGSVSLPTSNPLFQIIDDIDSATALYELPFKDARGAINITSSDSISASQACMLMADTMKEKLQILWDENYTSSGFDMIKTHSKTLCTSKQSALGFKFKSPIEILSKVAKTNVQ